MQNALSYYRISVPMNTRAMNTRDSLNHELVLGRSYFKDKIEEMTKRQTRLGQPGKPKVEEEAAV